MEILHNITCTIPIQESVMRKRLISSLIVILAVCAACLVSCSKKTVVDTSSPEAQTKGDTPVTQIAQTDTSFAGTITFLCGTVTMTVSGTNTPIDIGSDVPVNAVIETGNDAVCEVQFADFGSVHIDSDSNLCVYKLLSDKTHTESGIQLQAGKVVCKVRKLMGDDSFKVRTPEMVCGVRGTVFQVVREETGQVKVAVETGAVAVYPTSLDTEASLPEKFSETVQACAPVVAAGQEAAIATETAKKLDEAYTGIIRTINTNPEADIVEQVEQYQAISATMITKRTSVSEKNRESFRNAATLDLARPGETGPAKITVSLIVDPPDAVTTINGMSSVKGSFSGSFDEGTTLNVRIDRGGYESTTESIVIEGTAKIVRTVSLIKKPEDTSLLHPVSTDRLVTVSVSGSGSRYVSDSRSVVYAINPDGSIHWTAKTDNGSNTLNPPVYGNGVVAFAGGRSLSVFDGETGKQLWSITLDKSNTGLYGRHPVITAGKIFLANDSGLTVYESKTGTMVGTIPFANGSDMSPAFASGMIHIISKSGVWYKINADTLAIEKSLDTGAIQPVANTPAISGNTVVFVNRKGTVSAINSDTGTLLWQKKLEPTKSIDVFTDPLIASGGVYVYAKGTFYALELTSGKPRFAPRSGAVSSACFAGGILWYGEGTSLVALKPENGSVVKKISAGDTVSGTPIFYGKTITAPLASGKLLVYTLQ